MFVEHTSATPCTSPDGYVRLPLAAFLNLVFDDRARWVDEDLREDLRAENLDVTRAGFCEWQSGAGSVRISLGWAWYEIAGEAHITPDEISSNLMFLDSQGQDLGCRKTQSLLKAWLSLQPWSGVAPAATRRQKFLCNAGNHKSCRQNADDSTGDAQRVAPGGGGRACRLSL